MRACIGLVDSQSRGERGEPAAGKVVFVVSEIACLHGFLRRDIIVAALLSEIACLHGFLRRDIIVAVLTSFLSILTFPRCPVASDDEARRAVKGGRAVSGERIG